MIRPLSILALAAAFAAPMVMHADTIDGAISAVGSTAFTDHSITFGTDSEIKAGLPGSLTGTFATYLADGDPVDFAPGNLPYSQGNNTAPGGAVMLFSTTGNNETFTFFIQSYTANYTTDTVGCQSAQGSVSCLNVTGSGYFVGSGVVDYDQSPGAFSFSSQLVNGQTSTTFSASANAAPPVPEPSTLALLGSGVFGMAGLVRRRMRGSKAV